MVKLFYILFFLFFLQAHGANLSLIGDECAAMLKKQYIILKNATDQPYNVFLNDFSITSTYLSSLKQIKIKDEININHYIVNSSVAEKNKQKNTYIDRKNIKKNTPRFEFISEKSTDGLISKANSISEINVNKRIFTITFNKSGNKFACFKRFEWTWFIFEGKSNTDLNDLFNGKFGSDFKMIEDYNYTIFKLKTDLVPKIFSVENNYFLDFDSKNSDFKKQKQLDIKSDYKILKIPFDESMVLVNVFDPDSLEKMTVALVSKQQNSINDTYKYPHVKIVPAEFGIVFLNLANGVTITNDEGFIVVNLPNFINKPADVVTFNSPMLSLCNWYFGDVNDFYNVSLMLGLEVQNSKNKPNALDAHLNIVKFYLAHNMAKEALGHVAYIKRHYLDAIYNNLFIFLSSVTLYFSRSYNQVSSELEKIDITTLTEKQNEEVKFWKSLAKLESQADDSLLSTYYNSYKCNNNYYEDIEVAVFKNIISQEDEVDKVGKLYEDIKKLMLSEHNSNVLLISFARFMLEAGMIDKGMAIFSNIINNMDDPQLRAQAMFERTKFLVENSRIDAKEAIEILNTLKVIWHGKDELDGEVLKLLAYSYLNDHQYYKALETFNDINLDTGVDDLMFFDVGKKMRNIFLDIFYNAKVINELSPLEKVAIFFSFENLIPIGATGADLSLKFVDYLLSLDLVDSAILILDHLIDFRLQGDVRNKAIIIDANLYLNSRSYTKLIALMEKWDFENEELAIIKSKAYIAIKNYEKAEEAIKNYSSQGMEFLKAYLYWISNDTKKIRSFLEPKLHFRANPKAPLSDVEKLFILYLSDAYVIDNDKEDFLALYSDFESVLKIDSDSRCYKVLSMIHTVFTLDNVEQLEDVRKMLNELANENIQLNRV